MLSQQEFAERVNQIARELDGNWIIQPDEHVERVYNRATLTRTDGAELTLSNGSYDIQNRFAIRGSYPTMRGYGVYRPKSAPSRITCAETRTAAAIAGDISRRYLPAYLVAWQEAVAEVEKHEAEIGHHNAMTRLAAHHMHGRVLKDHDRLKPRLASASVGGYDQLSATAVYNAYKGKFRIEMSYLSEQEMIRILDLFHQLRAGETAEGMIQLAIC